METGCPALVPWCYLTTLQGLIYWRLIERGGVGGQRRDYGVQHPQTLPQPTPGLGLHMHHPLTQGLAEERSVTRTHITQGIPQRKN